MGEDPYLTVKDVAERFNMSTATVRNYCKSGRLPAVRPAGREFRILRSSLDRFEAELIAAQAVSSQIAAKARLDEAIAAGRLPHDVPPEVLGQIARILRQHYLEQAAS